MGTYATTTALATVMVGVNFSATGMATLTSKAVDHAEAEVNKYLSKRYDISGATFQTSASIPPLVRMLTEQLAEGYCWRWLSRGSKESLARGSTLIKEAKENLVLIADGSMPLIDTAGSTVTEDADSTSQIKCNTTNYTDTFGEDSELNWAPDSDKIDDIEDSRD